MPETPPVFLPYQKQLMQSVYDNPVTVVEKSRRTGYSWAMGGIASLIASAERSAGGQDVLYLGYNLEMAREFIDYVADFSKQILKVAANVQDTVFEDDTRPEKSIKAFRIEFASGFKVLALPSVPRSLRGMQGLVVIDEAAFHDDLPEVMKAAFALLIWGGKVVIISTHDGAENPFNSLCEDIKKGNLPYKLLHCSFDEAVRDGLFKRICFTRAKNGRRKRKSRGLTGFAPFTAIPPPRNWTACRRGVQAGIFRASSLKTVRTRPRTFCVTRSPPILFWTNGGRKKQATGWRKICAP